MDTVYNDSMKKFSKPAVGSQITVTTYYEKAGFSPLVPKSYTKVGVVVKSASYDEPDSFRLATDNKYYPISVVSLESVVSLVYADGTKGATEDKKIIEINAWEVPSSKKGSYTVTRSGKHFSCSCAGFQFRKSCKHILQIQSQVA